RVDDRVPIVPRHVERRLANVAASVVDENVDVINGLERRGDGSCDARLFAHIELQRRGAAAQRLNLATRGIERSQRTTANDEIRAGRRERTGERLPQPAAGAGHKGGSSGEVKIRSHMVSKSS